MKKVYLFWLISGIILLSSCHSGLESRINNRKVSVKKTVHPQVIMKTRFGTIVVELYQKKAPVTVANFERYIRENRFKDASFFRTVTMKNQPAKKVKIQVIQGRFFGANQPAIHPPIKLETTKQTGLHHLNGTLSMARDKPNSATDEFFICIGNQPSLDYGGKRNPDGQGFAAFGQVINGMDVVRIIQHQPSDHQSLTPPVKIDTIFLRTEK